MNKFNFRSAALSIALASITVSGCGGNAQDASSSAFGSLASGRSASSEIPCSKYADPRLKLMTDAGILSASSLGLASGRYVLPASGAPTQLVVMFHGHGNDSCSWRNHLRQVAAKGAIAVAMDYTGQKQTPIENYGWFVRAGAADSIAAAKYFLAAYPSIKQVYAFGISMGGNASGVAIASPAAVRADGSPLFDYWVDIEGVNNLTEEYLILRAVAPGLADAALAQKEIEEENGGPIESAPDKYREITNVAQAQQMAGLKGAVMVNGLDDGLVPTNQSIEMALALNVVGVPTHQYSVGGNGGAESGTTATAIPLGPVLGGAGQTYSSPLAGHGWEGSDTHLVIKTGFEQLYALMAGGTVSPGFTPVPGN